eukprot:Selendium_serpulae@DN5758_c0_g1_i1.p1
MMTDNKTEALWEFATLVSSTGGRVVLDRKVAEECDVLSRMLNRTEFSEGRSRTVSFPTIRTEVLQKFVEYLYYRHCYKDVRGRIPEFEIQDDVVLDLLLAANYLNE